MTHSSEDRPGPSAQAPTDAAQHVHRWLYQQPENAHLTPMVGICTGCGAVDFDLIRVAVVDFCKTAACVAEADSADMREQVRVLTAKLRYTMLMLNDHEPQTVRGMCRAWGIEPMDGQRSADILADIIDRKGAH